MDKEDLKNLLNSLADNMNNEASRLKESDVFHPEQGGKYYFNLRANILQDFACSIRITANKL